MDDKLLEPLKAYKECYGTELRHNAEVMFDELAARSGVDIAQNRATVKKYDAKLRLIDKTNKLIGDLKAKRGLLTALIVIGGILLIFGFIQLLHRSYVYGGISAPIGIILILVGAIVIAKKIKPRLAEMKKEKMTQSEAAQKLLDEANKQMAPLNALFEDTMTKQLIEKTVPLIKIDDNFDMRRYDYLSGKYGFGEDDNENFSTIGILTGEILGNPFVVDRKLIHSLGSFTYTGSLLITWTEVTTDSEGHARTVHHSQTLHASVTKPKPFYSSHTRLIYGNDAAPSLHFSRTPSHSEDLNEKQLERKIKKGVKKIRARQEDSNKFTEMGNEEFDVLFGALNRDNEVEFRLLFTPLAQKNMLALLKDAEGYGDDFQMQKSGCLNYISSEHSAQWDPDTDPSAYRSHSFDLAKKKFVSFNDGYFRSLYFDLAPLLSIPLYQQQKPREYIYKESYPRNYTRYETEYAVNHIRQGAFAPVGAATGCILKTSLLRKDGKSDKVLVTAHAYRTEERVDFVPTLGGDGHIHDVPVHWTEYIPIKRNSTVMLKELGVSTLQFASVDEIKQRILRRNIANFGYGHGILCCVTEDDSEFDSDFDITKNNFGG